MPTAWKTRHNNSYLCVDTAEKGLHVADLEVGKNHNGTERLHICLR